MDQVDKHLQSVMDEIINSALYKEIEGILCHGRELIYDLGAGYCYSHALGLTESVLMLSHASWQAVLFPEEGFIIWLYKQWCQNLAVTGKSAQLTPMETKGNFF